MVLVRQEDMRLRYGASSQSPSESWSGWGRPVCSPPLPQPPNPHPTQATGQGEARSRPYQHTRQVPGGAPFKCPFLKNLGEELGRGRGERRGAP